MGDESELKSDTQPKQTDFEYDVFISYSTHDKEWVRRELLQGIEKAGLKAFIDFRDFTRGAPSIKECERGVIQCRRTLLILTPDYLGSEWGEIENIMAQTLDPANRKLRLIPLLKKECQKPLRIGALTYIDFTNNADHDLAWRQLLTALGKPPEPTPSKTSQHADWFLAHPYPMAPNFTGRVAERAMLTNWLDVDDSHPLLILRALGGFGKSALVWHWLMHDLKPGAWPRVVWWSFYESDANFDHFLSDALDYLSVDKTVCQSLSAHERVEMLQHIFHKSGTLLVLDGFERVLRAFSGLNAAYQGDEESRFDANDCDCISPLADRFLRGIATLPGINAKVLLTSRLRPRAVEHHGSLLHGCREEDLKQMQPADAVEFFHAQGIRGTHTEIETECEPYGYHPLSLRLLAGLIVGDFQQPGDIVVAKRLDVFGNLKQRQHHVLETAYNSIVPARQTLLSRIACFRSPVPYEALQTLAKTLNEPSASLDSDLRDLVARGLLHHDIKEGGFDLHPIVRRYSYNRLAMPDRATTHALLRDYFAAVPPPGKVTHIKDLAPVIELYHHTVRAGQYDEACYLFIDHLQTAIYFQLGAYLLHIELLRTLFADGEDRLPRLTNQTSQTWVLNALANSYCLIGQPQRAVPLFQLHNALCEKIGIEENLATGLGNLAFMAQRHIGALRAAETNLRRRIALCREINDKFHEALGRRNLGLLLAYCGAYTESKKSLEAAWKLFEKGKNLQSKSISWNYESLRELLQLRTLDILQSTSANLQSAISLAQNALKLADEASLSSFPAERDYVHAHWLLGAALLAAGQQSQAECHLHEALQRCRHISLVEVEANILIALARLYSAIGTSEEAQRLAEEALLITERSGYVLQGADAHLELAKLALTRGDKTTALKHATEARHLATCDGPPDYTYKAAYEEAGALLAKLEN
ncbi:MAG: toll/interleukin-1 receptor domain-containing protein [Candidatus Aminicenantes bacterium]|nr:toll/interleukin-1 receptor domain-containing protein [Candidatus Aminicenantes bacterium]